MSTIERITATPSDLARAGKTDQSPERKRRVGKPRAGAWGSDKDCISAHDDIDFTAHTEARRRAWVLEQTDGRGADVTIECTGAPVAVTQAFVYTRDAGTVVVVGQYTDHGDVEFNPHTDLNRKHLDVRGCWGSDYSHFHRAIDMLRTDHAAALWSTIKLERYSLSQTNEALGDVASAKAIKALIAAKR